MILRTCGVRLRVHGLDRLARDRSYVFMATHGSHFDGYAIAAALPHQWRAVLDAGIRRVPVFGWIGVLAGHVFLDRARAATAIEGLERAAETIRGGISVLIFPEGTFREDAPQLRPLKRGGFHLALRAGACRSCRSRSSRGRPGRLASCARSTSTSARRSKPPGSATRRSRPSWSRFGPK